MMAAARAIPIPAYLFLCLVLGGASNAGFIANGVLQLLGILLLAWSLWGPGRSVLVPLARFLSALLVAVLILIAVQFLPIPTQFWEYGGGRTVLADEANLAGIGLTPHFWGLLPYEAFKSALWALPWIALVVAMLRLPYWKPAHLAFVVMGVMVASVILGTIQLVQGNASPAYIYTNTNRELSVGFFSNSNHLATFLLMTVPFIAATMRSSAKAREGHALPSMLMGLAFLLVALTGIAVNGSLVGYGLIGPVLAASALILFPAPRLRKISVLALPLIIAAGFALVLTSEQGLQFLDLNNMPANTGRPFIWARTIAAVQDFMPLGSGLGTFAEIFPRYEDAGAVTDVYVNHAHNDYLELLLEFGILVVPVFAAFLIWWTLRAKRIWLAAGSNPYAQAALIASGVVLVHSVVDYPLRTAAIGSLFGACIVMMNMWVPGDQVLLRARDAE